MIYQNVLEAMGHTPMIQLNKMTDPEGARVLVKFEGRRGRHSERGFYYCRTD